MRAASTTRSAQGTGSHEMSGLFFEEDTMFVVLAYYSDGSGKSEICFIEQGDGTADDLARATSKHFGKGQTIEIFKIVALDSSPEIIWPVPSID